MPTNEDFWFNQRADDLQFAMDQDRDNTYSGAPDECGWCFRHGEIVKFNDEGNCPNAGNPDHARF